MATDTLYDLILKAKSSLHGLAQMAGDSDDEPLTITGWELFCLLESIMNNLDMAMEKTLLVNDIDKTLEKIVRLPK